jgi:basic membrane protein A
MNGLVLLRAGKFVALVATAGLLLPLGALPAGAVSSIKIAIAYDIGGRGDHGINDSAAKGVDAIKKKYGLTSLAVREMVTNGTESDRQDRLQFLAAAHYNLIIAVGAGYARSLGVVANAFPDTEFALINDASVGSLNISDMIFSNSDGAYLAGTLAASATKSKKVAFIAPSSMAGDLLAFQRGVASVAPKTKVLSSFVDTDLAAATRALVAQGSDIIFSAWSTTGEVQDTVAALNTKKRPLFLIGVNPDQYFLLDKTSQKILIGAVSKHIDVAVKDVMVAALEKQQVIDVLDGPGGIFGHIYTVKDGGESMALTALGAPYSIKVAAAVARLKSGKVKSS